MKFIRIILLITLIILLISIWFSSDWKIALFLTIFFFGLVDEFKILRRDIEKNKNNN